MLDITTALVFGFVALLGYWFLGRKTSKLPPGPSAFATLTFFNAATPNADNFLKLYKQYPDLFTFKTFFGGPPTIMVNSYDLIKKLFVQNAESFSNRPKLGWLGEKLTKGKGIGFNPDNWRVPRRFTLHSMRDFGLGKQSLEERIQEEAIVLTEQFRSKRGQPFDPAEDVTKTVSNIICSITFGKRYSHDDAEFTEVLDKLEGLFRTNFAGLHPANTLPWSRHLGFLFGALDVTKPQDAFEAIKKFIREEIRKHRETYDENNIRDLVDLFIQAEKNDFKDHNGLDEDDLFESILDLFIAGTDTTTGTLRWILLRLIHNPDVQKKCQQEIAENIGRERIPEYRERNQLPYTMATILESLRIDCVALGSIPHRADKDFEVGEYVIPKGATVMAITRGLMYDPKVWGEDVYAFRPERWLNQDGTVRNFPEFIPFCIGKRACPGEQLSRIELFIDTVALLQRFTFRAEDPRNPPKIEGTYGATFVPKPFKLIADPIKKVSV